MLNFLPKASSFYLNTKRRSDLLSVELCRTVQSFRKRYNRHTHTQIHREVNHIPESSYIDKEAVIHRGEVRSEPRYYHQIEDKMAQLPFLLGVLVTLITGSEALTMTVLEPIRAQGIEVALIFIPDSLIEGEEYRFAGLCVAVFLISRFEFLEKNRLFLH
ncbi:hypothetical protein RRG08_054451 [Elysia crispata]|uniref:Uncharacterized protein n=1 Tax=Elysia crispata TaxID=231223 RepID=A0AAE1AVU9_9GAST|nr:hypothetical protein RRG08_054451 [Elysia crispata]